MAMTPDRAAFLATASAWLTDRDVSFDVDHLSAWIGYHWRHIENSPDPECWAEEYAAELFPDGPFRKRFHRFVLPRGAMAKEIVKQLRRMHEGNREGKQPARGPGRKRKREK
jgi:hypothetical protein